MAHIPLELIDIQTSLEGLPGWTRVSVDGIDRIQRTFEFRDPTHAFSFTRSLGELAEHFHHHPSLLVERNSVTVAWWTFAICALAKVDFNMAARTDRLYEAMAV